MKWKSSRAAGCEQAVRTFVLRPWSCVFHYGLVVAVCCGIAWFTGCAGLRISQKTSKSESVTDSAFVWVGESVEADGRGIAPMSLTTEPQRSLAAKQSAKTAAIAGLKHKAARLSVTGSQTLGSVMAMNLSVKRAVEKYLQTAEVVHEKEIEPGVWEVRMRAPLAPIAQILLEHKITPQSIPILPASDTRMPPDS